MAQVENQMFMNFLNLQHLGEVDEEQQLKKEHFDIKAKEVLAQSSSRNLQTNDLSRAKNYGKVKNSRETKEDKEVIPLVEYDVDFHSMIRNEYLYKTYNKDQKTSRLFPFEEENDNLRKAFIEYKTSINDTVHIHKKLCYRLIPPFKLSLFD